MFRALEEEPLRRRLLEAGFTAPQLRAAGSGAYLWHQGSLRIESLRLDHGEVPWSAGAPGDAQPERIAGYVIEGDLVIDGNLVNGEQDFGPVLVVLGALSARNVAIAGAPLFVRGDLRVQELFHGYYNHGSLVVLGDVTAQVFIASDYFGEILGVVRAEVLAFGHCKGAPPLCTKRSDQLLVDAAHAPNPDYYEEDEGDEADPEQDREPPFVVDDSKIFSLIERGDPAVLGGVRTADVMLRRRQ